MRHNKLCRQSQTFGDKLQEKKMILCETCAKNYKKRQQIALIHSQLYISTVCAVVNIVSSVNQLLEVA